MPSYDRHKLHFGPYRTPHFQYGQKVDCLARGEVTIAKLSSCRIPWPVGQKVSALSLVLYKDLARAVRRESSVAVRHWWGVGAAAVWKWRKALRVPRWNDGDLRLKVAIGKSDALKPALAAMHSKARDPVRREKIAAARRGKPRPQHVIEAMRAGRLRKKVSVATKAKMSESHKRRGTRPPWLNQPWAEWENELVRTLPAPEAVKRTGRTMFAVKSQRRLLGVPDGRTKSERRKFGR